jgi:hypothetical protein
MQKALEGIGIVFMHFFLLKTPGSLAKGMKEGVYFLKTLYNDTCSLKIRISGCSEKTVKQLNF